MNSLLVNVDVNDLDKAVGFYTLAFDLWVGRKFGGEVIELLGSSSPIYLLSKKAGSSPFTGAKSGRNYSRHWSPIHLDFVVESIDIALMKAIGAGAILEGEPREAKWGKIATLADPFGNGFCIIEFVGRGYDEIAD